MITATWNRLWDIHDDAKDRLMFFVKPNTTRKKDAEKTADDEGFNKNDGGKGDHSYTKAQLIGLILGPLFFTLILMFFEPGDLSKEGVGILASTVWIATWWITEALPIPVTSLLPLILFPLTNGLDIKTTASQYGDETVFLFMGGFMIALAMEKWNLHRRIALWIISIIGTNTDRIVLGFMVATGFLSMWISNTATAMMMVPMGIAITYQVADALKGTGEDTSRGGFGFGKALMLGIAYSASLGGVATLIGTPPNTLLAGAMDTMYGIELSFAKWMIFGVPFAWVFIFIVWFYLTKIAYPTKVKTLPGGQEVFAKEREKLGSASTEEKLVFTIFVLAAFSWITRSF
ncbi:MAG TPA: SLC13 family permease, partial [Pseudogracilibacillus sp.]|nr:SLC13 family permease [Pseudogracilibacillus sp.]